MSSGRDPVPPVVIVDVDLNEKTLVAHLYYWQGVAQGLAKLGVEGVTFVLSIDESFIQLNAESDPKLLEQDYRYGQSLWGFDGRLMGPDPRKGYLGNEILPIFMTFKDPEPSLAQKIEAAYQRAQMRDPEVVVVCPPVVVFLHEGVLVRVSAQDKLEEIQLAIPDLVAASARNGGRMTALSEGGELHPLIAQALAIAELLEQQCQNPTAAGARAWLAALKDFASLARDMEGAAISQAGDARFEAVMTSARCILSVALSKAGYPKLQPPSAGDTASRAAQINLRPDASETIPLVDYERVIAHQVHPTSRIDNHDIADWLACIPVPGNAECSEPQYAFDLLIRQLDDELRFEAREEKIEQLLQECEGLLDESIIVSDYSGTILEKARQLLESRGEGPSR